MSQQATHDFTSGHGRAYVVLTDRADGSFRVDQEDLVGLEERRRRIVDLPWVWLTQVHGSRVVTVDAAGPAVTEVVGTEADALVTAVPDVALAIHTADCAPVAFLGATTGLVGAAHAGWRGLLDGVLEATVERMRDLGETDVRAYLGPCICPREYEFGAAELTQLTDRLGISLQSSTTTGRPALDLREGVRAALAGVSVELSAAPVACTAEHPEGYYSHRARGDEGRQAMVVWREAA